MKWVEQAAQMEEGELLNRGEALKEPGWRRWGKAHLKDGKTV